jgi:tetratricopeptide (TPR) repeat protein
MFFTRLRRGSKWVFIAVIFAFAFTFLFAGVGSGGSGGDIIQELLGMRGGSDPLKSAEKAVAKNPHNAGALIRLAQAYNTKQRSGDAIRTYEKYLTIKPKDSSVLLQLGLLQRNTTAVRWERYAGLQSKLTLASGPVASDPLQTLVGIDSLTSAYTSLLTTKVSSAYGSYTTAAKAWESTEKHYLATVPASSTLQRAQIELELAQAAASAGHYPTAINSYETFLRLTPKDSRVAQVKKALVELRKASSSS